MAIKDQVEADRATTFHEAIGAALPSHAVRPEPDTSDAWKWTADGILWHLAPYSLGDARFKLVSKRVELYVPRTLDGLQLLLNVLSDTRAIDGRWAVLSNGGIKRIVERESDHA